MRHGSFMRNMFLESHLFQANTFLKLPSCCITSNRLAMFSSANADVSKGVQGLLDLSDAQLEDLMLLRQLYVTRRHLLNVKRVELMAGAQEKMPHPVDSVTRMSELAAHLQKNASEDHNLLYNMSRAFYCGVSTTASAGLGVHNLAGTSHDCDIAVCLSGTAWSLPCLSRNVCWHFAKSSDSCYSQATELCLALHS